MPLDVVIVPCLSDNYAYLLRDEATGEVAVVDVPESAPILAALDARGWTPGQVLITHHHGDHIDGVPALVAATGAKVTGAAADAHRLPPLDHQVRGGDRVQIGATSGEVIEVYGHTIGHVAFHFPGAKAAFTADSLMTMGCGRIFEGTPLQMWDTLARLAALPEETQIYTGHEYTQANARFAVTVDAANAALTARVADIAALRAADRPTVPSTLALEKATNPFLRATDPGVKAGLGLAGAPDAEVFARIRSLKDNFKG
jgi:hydroxyacylglutathione hydrolase